MIISLCDDEPVQLKLLTHYIEEWKQLHNIPITIHTYKSSEDFLFHFADDPNVDILLLDIEMPGMNGMELAKHLRKTDDQIQMIFVTGKTEYVYEGYSVNAVSYLLKPIKKEQFFQCLEKAMLARDKTSKVIFAEDGGSLQKIKLDDIYYIESIQHNTLLHTIDGILPNKSGMTEVIHKLSALGELKSFCRVHRCYLVHIARIKCITKKEVITEDDSNLPIARGKWEEVNLAYLAYYRQE